MRKVAVDVFEDKPETYDADEMFDTFTEHGRAVYAKVESIYPSKDVAANGDTDENGYDVGDIVLLIEAGGEGHVIWLNDGEEMEFERANVCLRFVPLGENETITISPN